MKRFVYLLLVAVLVVGCGKKTTTSGDRVHVLKVYNWADYIDEDVLKGFPAWYESITGEKVEVVYQTFDINESMLTQIEKGHEDFDVICPSEYIIERMLKNDLLLPIDKECIPEEYRYFDNVSPYVVEQFQKMSNTKNVSDYTVGYMWGTTGFVYNTAKVNAADMQSWGALLNSKYEGKILAKDAMRDVYSVIVQYAYYDELQKIENDSARKAFREDLVKNITQERINAVEKVLMNAKKNIAGWEVDFGKEEMIKGTALVNLSWSGDAAWAIEEAAKSGVKLAYTVPKEGTNVWFDGWCIPKYAKNKKAASYFISYMCRPDNAIKNMNEIGYTSVIATPEILEEINDPESNDKPLDLTYFFPEEVEGVDSVYASIVQYPDAEIITRSALMHDAGDQSEALLKMWNKVKGNKMSKGVIIAIVAVVLVALTYAAMKFVYRKKGKKTKKNKKQ